MKITLKFDIGCDIIEVNGLTFEEVKELKGDFYHWLRNHNHQYWFYDKNLIL